jgi:hypothetical protein
MTEVPRKIDGKGTPSYFDDVLLYVFETSWRHAQIISFSNCIKGKSGTNKNSDLT